MRAPINIAFWTDFYRTREDPNSVYHSAIASHQLAIDRAEALWDWKDLSRGVDFESIRPAIEAIQLEKYATMEPAEAVDGLGRRLVEEGGLSNATVVTPAFLLHLETSDPNKYSSKFPIFDARVWTAFVYLDGRRTGDESLPVGATTSARKYGEFVEFFRETLPEDVDGRTYELALFRFGSYINRLSVDSVGDIKTHLSTLEQMISDYQTQTGQALSSQR